MVLAAEVVSLMMKQSGGPAPSHPIELLSKSAFPELGPAVGARSGCPSLGATGLDLWKLREGQLECPPTWAAFLLWIHGTNKG